MMVIKEKKEMDDCFKKAQKPWVKILTKVNKTKLDYHNACKAERSAANQERNATGDNAVSPEQVIDFFSFSLYSSPFLSVRAYVGVQRRQYQITLRVSFFSFIPSLPILFFFFYFT
jgi:hypothetical protein